MLNETLTQLAYYKEQNEALIKQNKELKYELDNIKDRLNRTRQQYLSLLCDIKYSLHDLQQSFNSLTAQKFNELTSNYISNIDKIKYKFI